MSALNATEILKRISLGEDSYTAFKREPIPPAKLAEEMVAFLNAHGGLILFGVDDDGEVAGLAPEQVRLFNANFSSACTDYVRPACYPDTQLLSVGEGAAKRMIMAVSIPEGLSKPYSDKGGRYWIRLEADKRTIQEREQLQRLMQESQLLYADEIPVPGTTPDELDFQKLSTYLQRDRNASFDEVVKRTALPVERLLENLGLVKNGSLTLAALLLFGKTPQRFRPAFCVKAVSYVGNDRAGTVYRDSEDITGDLEALYERTMSFLTRNLHHVQGNAGFNSLGTLEVSYAALEETVVNMLIHRDYFISAPWRVFIFDNRIELVSPGALPNHLTIENVKNGISNLRNPLLASFATKMLPYRGMGTGIMRTLREMPTVELRSDRDAGEFTVVIPRNTSNA